MPFQLLILAMDNRENNIVDRLFEDHLQDATIAPPEGLWDDIAADLENDRLRKKVVYWRMVAAGIALLFLMAGGLTMLRFGFTGPGQLTSENILSLPFSQGEASSASSESRTPLPSNLETEKQAAVNDLQPSLNQARNRAVVPVSSLPEKAKAFQLSSRTTENLRDALEKARKEQLQPVREKAQAPVILASLKTAKANIATEHPGYGMRSDLVEQVLVQNTAADPNEHTALPVKLKQKKVPRRLRKERPGFQLLADGGENQSRKTRKRKWAIGGSFSPDVAFATSTPVDNASLGTAAKVSLPDDPANATTKQSAPVATFTTGMRASIDLNDRLALQSGIQYTRRTTSASHEAVSRVAPGEFDNNFRLGYLEIPLSVRYKYVAMKKLDLFVASGVSGNFFVDYKQELETPEGRVAARNVSDESDVFNPSQANFLLSTGIQYRIKDQVSLNLEPGFRYGFLTSKYSFSRDDPVSLSLATGVNFHF